MRAKILKGEKHPMFGKARTEGAGKPCHPIEVIDIQNNVTNSFDSIHKASIALNIPFQAISNYFIRNQKKPYKGRYTFKKL